MREPQVRQQQQQRQESPPPVHLCSPHSPAGRITVNPADVDRGAPDSPDSLDSLLLSCALGPGSRSHRPGAWSDSHKVWGSPDPNPATPLE